MLRIAVFCSGGGTNLQAIIDAGINISLVVASKPGIYAIHRAEEKNIPVAVTRNQTEIIELLHTNRINLVVLTGWTKILSNKFFSEYKGKIINIHPSLLPSFGGKGFYGLKVHEAVLAAGVKVTGATVHYVTEDVDAGPILLQKVVDVIEGDTPETLQRRVMEEAERIILVEAILNEDSCDRRRWQGTCDLLAVEE